MPKRQQRHRTCACLAGLAPPQCAQGPLAYRIETPAARLSRRLHGPGVPLAPAFADAAHPLVAQQLAMAAAVAPFIDGAVSKTVNLPASSTLQDFDALFVAA